MTLRARLSRLLLAVLVFGIGAGLAVSAPQESTPPAAPEAPATNYEEKLGPVSPQVTQALLNLVNNGKDEALYRTPGFIRQYIDKIKAYRASGKTFTTLEELQKVAGMPTLDLGMAVASFEEAMPSQPIITRGKGKAGRAQAQGEAGAAAPLDGAQEPVADPNANVTGQGPIGNVRPGYFAKLPGYENLDSIDPLKKKEFLETINRETCSCGCQNETLAFCLVNDPSCPVVKARVKKIYDDIVSRPPR